MINVVKKIAYFRFYAELNDFLPYKNRMTQFEYHFWGTPSVKNAIQALGVPHSEVDLILVNSNPVNFSYQLKPRDIISVYPTFESFDISGINQLRNEQLRKLRFIIDANLGKLSRYVRMLGFDALYDNQIEDLELIRISNKENRIILTRDLEILKQNTVRRGYFIRSTEPKKQIQEVIQRFDLRSDIKPFSRCMECNGLLHGVQKQQITQQLDGETLSIFDEFFRCDSCKRIYWKGSHYKRMMELIEEVMKATSVNRHYSSREVAGLDT